MGPTKGTTRGERRRADPDAADGAEPEGRVPILDGFTGRSGDRRTGPRPLTPPGLHCATRR
ncbi:hypothetical protein GCM10025331_55190 [Actinoplanes utahensis]|nr:hypothetical protein Aut01nite_61800 [Actinoplanes utahensis]